MFMPYSNEYAVAVVVYCLMYLHQYVEYLEVDLIGSKATNQKQEKIFIYFSCLGQGLIPGLFSPESSALPSEPSHLYSWIGTLVRSCSPFSISFWIVRLRLRLLRDNHNQKTFSSLQACALFSFIAEVDFMNSKSWAQSHFTLYAKHLRSFFRRKSSAQSEKAWRRA